MLGDHRNQKGKQEIVNFELEEQLILFPNQTCFYPIGIQMLYESENPMFFQNHPQAKRNPDCILFGL